MTEFSKASNMVAGGRSVGAGMDDARRADHVQALRWPGVRRACPALAVASALIAGASVYAAVAVAQDAPNLNRIWAGCALSQDTVDALLLDVAAGGIEDPEIAFVVVYSLNNDNDGQPVTVQGQAGFTGPVICRNTDVVSAPVPTSQTDNVGTVTILDAEEAFLLRLGSGSSISKRVCHTVNNNTDCFRISP
jgi:hypothetical protein